MTTMNPQAADPRWASLAARDSAADGTFVYAVKTTRVFCRPSCPARPAKPENIRFFATGAEAETAGFRACLRCRPLAAEGRDPMTARMQEVATQIRDHAGETLPLAKLAAGAGMSAFHLQRSFTAVLGVSPKAYQAAERLAAFKRSLRDGNDILSATYDSGYGSTSRIYEQVDGGLGMTPSAYRAGGAGEHIAYAIRDTAIGKLLMAATARGVCLVQFAETEAALFAQLAAEFPKATLSPAGTHAQSHLDRWMAALEDHLSRGAPRPDLPLDLKGTAFQIRVWRFLLSVKPGAVVTYTELAAGIGAPKAVRAAASACAANRIAVLIPCHRALRADGGLGGYRWGLPLKRTLLDQERAAVHA